MRSVAMATLLAASVLAGACAGVSGRVYVRTGPPPIRAERVLVSPGPEFVWIPGYYAYERGGYVWIAGHYERGPRARARWVPGHWQRDRRGWYYVQGHWR